MPDTEQQQVLMTSLLAEEGETTFRLVPVAEQTSSSMQRGNFKSGDWCLRCGLFCILCCLILIFIPLITACIYLSFLDNELITSLLILEETVQQPHAQFMATPTCNTDYYEKLIQYGTEGDYTCVYSFLLAYCTNEDSEVDIYYTSEGPIYHNAATDDDHAVYDDDDHAVNDDDDHAVIDDDDHAVNDDDDHAVNDDDDDYYNDDYFHFDDDIPHHN